MTDLFAIAGLIFIAAGFAHSIYVGGLRSCTDYNLMPDHEVAEPDTPSSAEEEVHRLLVEADHHAATVERARALKGDGWLEVWAASSLDAYAARDEAQKVAAEHRIDFAALALAHITYQTTRKRSDMNQAPDPTSSTDAFTIPTTFQEFIARYPKRIVRFVGNRGVICTAEEREERIADLSEHLRERYVGVLERGGESVAAFSFQMNLTLARRWMRLPGLSVDPGHEAKRRATYQLLVEAQTAADRTLMALAAE